MSENLDDDPEIEGVTFQRKKTKNITFIKSSKYIYVYLNEFQYKYLKFEIVIVPDFFYFFVLRCGGVGI